MEKSLHRTQAIQPMLVLLDGLDAALKAVVYDVEVFGHPQRVWIHA